MRLIYIPIMTLGLFACGSNSSQSGGGGEKPATKPVTTGQAPAQSPTKDPVVSNTPTTSTSPDFLQLAAVSTPINDGTKTISLAAKAKATGKPYTVFQFSGVTCESCKADSPKVQSDLSKLPNISRVIVFPNKVSEYTDGEYKGFVDQYASGADRLVDGNLSVLKAVRKDKTQFFGLYIVVRASDGKAFVINSDDAHLKIASAVKDLK